VRDDVEYKGDSAAVGLGARRCRDSEGVSALNDPAVVARDYADETRLAARIAAQQQESTGPDPRQVAFEAVAETEPELILEVGPGLGELAERMQRELDARVVAVDQSGRMVELTSARGVEAIVGDVEDLPFRDGIFDCAVAAWMLYHVANVDQAVSELRRVLRPGGRLVAVTNSAYSQRELWSLVGYEPNYSFGAENGESLLLRHFTLVERRDVRGTVTFPDREAVHRYVSHSLIAAHLAEDLPYFDGPLVVSRHVAVFVAENP
jgi:SAM-dependent methyltransferase